MTSDSNFARDRTVSEIFLSSFKGEEDPSQRARRDVAFYLENTLKDEKTGEYIVLAPHHRELLEALEDPEIRFLVVELPRGGGKSTCLNGWQAWKASNNPSIRFIEASKTDDQAKLQLGGIQGIIKSPEHIRIYGNLVPTIKQVRNDGFFWNDQEKSLRGSPHSSRFPTFTAIGTGSALAEGRRSDVIVGDDLIEEKVAYSPALNEHIKDWFYRALLPTRDPRGAKVIVIGTPFAKGDLYDYIHEQMKGKPGYKRIRLTAFELDERGERKRDANGRYISYWPKMVSVEELMAREDEDWWAFQSQYMLERFDSSKAQFQRAWLKLIHERDMPDPRTLTIYQGIDPAGMKGDPVGDHLSMATVGVDGHGQGFFLSLLLTRGDKEETIQQIKDEVLRWRPKVLSVEVDGNQIHFKNWLEEQLKFSINPIYSKNVPKTLRLRSMSDVFRRGQILIAGGLDPDSGDLVPVPRIEPFFEQWQVFPVGAHDDALDAVNLAIHPIFGWAEAASLTMTPANIAEYVRNKRLEQNGEEEQDEAAKRRALLLEAYRRQMTGQEPGVGRFLAIPTHTLRL